MLDRIFDIAGAVLWGPPMLTAFLGTGALFTLRSRFFQFRGTDKWFGGTLIAAFRNEKLRKSQGENSISQFQALNAALAACMGTGNIVGVATAVSAGGPGAVFWMCISSVLGMMTACAEGILGIKYRVKNEKGEWLGGAMLYMQGGLGYKKTAKLYALLLALSSFGIGNMTQINSVSDALGSTFGISPYVTGIVACVLVSLVVCGGIKRIARVSEKIVPVISIVFIVSSFVVIAVNYKKIPQTAALILREATGLRPMLGGAAGYGVSKAARYGISRGVFSNEAGLGTSAVIHAAADTDSPARQGMWGMLEVFLDTTVMCTVTAFVILTSGVWDASAELDGASLFAASFASVLGKTGEALFAVTVSLLAFASITGWTYYGERGTEYLLGLRAVKYYRALFIAAIFIGSVAKLETVWNISDILNAMMAVPNLFCLLVMSNEVMRELKKFLK